MGREFWHIGLMFMATTLPVKLKAGMGLGRNASLKKFGKTVGSGRTVQINRLIGCLSPSLQMPSRILHDERDRKAWLAFVSAQPLPATVSLTKGARRSLPQNSTLHLWTGQIAAETSQTQAEAKAEVKLRFGLPIMERDNPEWVAKWEPLYGVLPYAMRLRLFEAIPLTSLLTTRQMAEMMDAIQKEYLGQGIPLVDPEARRLEQMYAR